MAINLNFDEKMETLPFPSLTSFIICEIFASEFADLAAETKGARRKKSRWNDVDTGETGELLMGKKRENEN